MRVSVIIPCYKDAKTLGRALDSVFSQSRLPDQVIVVNDASPETKEIEAVLASYPSVHYIVNSANRGLASTRNVGVQASTAEIVSFLDADDELHPQKIELQLLVYSPNSTVACNSARIGNERGTNNVERFSGKAKCAVFDDSSKLVRKNGLTGASLMIARELFLKLGGYDETLRSCEDFDLWLRILDAGIPALNVKLPLYLYRVNEAGLSSNLINISFWELEVVKKYFAHQHLNISKHFETLTYSVWLFKHLVRYEQCLDPKLLEVTQRNIKLLISSPFLRKAILMLQEHGFARLCLIARERKIKNRL